MDKTQILIKPIMTEKSLNQAGLGWYTFAVRTAATKPEIRLAVEENFGVKVLKVKTMIMKGKKVLTGRRKTVSRKSDWKKALVKLPPEQKIDLFTVSGSKES